MKLEWNSKRVWLAVAMSAMAGLQLFAAPFDRVWDVKQPDGTVIQIHGKGDDFHADMEVGGYTIVFDLPTKSYMYATRSADGKLLSSGLVAGRDNPSSANLNQHVRATEAVVHAERQERFTRWDQVTLNTSRWEKRKSATGKRLAPLSTTAISPLSVTVNGPVYSPPGSITTGDKAGLCLLIDFSDDVATIPQANIINFCNGDNYTGYGNNGSVKEYFQDVSNNRLTYTNIVTIYLRVPYPKTYYNDPDNGDAANELVKNALDVLKALPNYQTEIWPQLQSLTVDDEGSVAACNVYYAGHPDVGWAQGLWPHSWALYQVGAQSLGPGISVFRYQMTDIGNTLTLGTFCHENGHMLCSYPDIYDYNYDSSGGAGGFCLMNSGGSGGNPTKPCAYLRMHSGWLDVVDLETLTDFFLTLTTATTTIYKYTKPAVAAEYYLFENRQRSGRDANIPGSGIAIWHCDESGNRDDQRYVYNTLHQNREVQLMQADNQWHLNKSGANGGNSGEQVDLYYEGNTTGTYSNEFADDTAPSSKWWDGSLSGLYVGSFSVSGESMTMSASPLPPEIATTSPLPEGRVGSPYWIQLKTKDTYPSNVWSVVNVAMLPSGLTLAPSGLLSGVPTQAGTNTLDIVVKGRSSIFVTNTFELVILPCYTAPYSEGFNGAMEGELTGWHQECVSNAIPWRMRIGSPSTRPLHAFEGEKNAYLGVFNDNGSASFSPHVTRLISPMIQFGPYAREVRVSFAYYLEDWPPLDADILKVYYKTAWSDSWIGPIATYTTNTVGWTQQSITLPEAASVDGAGKGVYFAFEGSALGGHGISLDAIVIDDPVPPLHISTTTPLPIALCGTNYTLVSPLVTLESVGGFTNEFGLTAYQYAVVNETSLPSGFILTSDGVITGRWNSVIAMTNFDVEVTDSVSGAKATNTLSFLVEYPRASVLAESFNGDNVLSTGWTFEYVANTVKWQLGTAGGKDGWSPPATAQSDLQYAVFFGTPGVGTVMCTKLVSPVFDLTQMPNNTRLVFWHFMQQWEGQDELRVYYRNVQEGPWTKLATYTSNVTSWTQRIIPLPSPTRYYQIAFEGLAKSGYGVCIDTVSITDDGGAPVILTRDVLPSGFDNFSYQTTLEAVAGSTPYRWTVVSNGLPRGLVLDSLTGIISGIPVGSTQTVFRIAVTGEDNKASTNTFSLKILPPGIVPYFEPFATNALPESWEQVTATGSQAAWQVSQGTYSFYESFPSNLKSPMLAYSNSLPNNVCLWAFPKDDGMANSASLITKSFDLGGCTNTTLSFQLCMKAFGSYQDWLSVYYRSRETDAWTLLAAYKTNITVWTQQTLQLPNPSATYRLKFEGDALGGWGICIDDVDVRGEKSASPLAILSSTLLPEGTNHVAYPSVTLVATNGTLLPYTWRIVTSDSLPTGLTLDPNTGIISGTPTEYGFFTFGVTVQDANNVATTSNFNLRVYSGSKTPFEEWQITYFSALGYLGDNVDQSGDGIPNLIKYGMGLNPTNKNLGIYILGGLTNLAGSLNVADGRYLYLGYRRSLTATDVNFFVKGTTNLADGAIGWLTNNIVEQTPWIGGETDVWSWVYSVHTTPVTNAPQRFLRLEVSTNLTTNIY